MAGQFNHLGDLTRQQSEADPDDLGLAALAERYYAESGDVLLPRQPARRSWAGRRSTASASSARTKSTPCAAPCCAGPTRRCRCGWPRSTTSPTTCLRAWTFCGGACRHQPAQRRPGRRPGPALHPNRPHRFRGLLPRQSRAAGARQLRQPHQPAGLSAEPEPAGRSRSKLRANATAEDHRARAGQQPTRCCSCGHGRRQPAAHRALPAGPLVLDEASFAQLYHAVLLAVSRQPGPAHARAAGAAEPAGRAAGQCQLLRATAVFAGPGAACAGAGAGGAAAAAAAGGWHHGHCGLLPAAAGPVAAAAGPVRHGRRPAGLCCLARGAAGARNARVCAGPERPARFGAGG